MWPNSILLGLVRNIDNLIICLLPGIDGWKRRLPRILIPHHNHSGMDCTGRIEVRVKSSDEKMVNPCLDKVGTRVRVGLTWHSRCGRPCLWRPPSRRGGRSPRRPRRSAAAATRSSPSRGCNTVVSICSIVKSLREKHVGYKACSTQVVWNIYRNSKYYIIQGIPLLHSLKYNSFYKCDFTVHRR